MNSLRFTVLILFAFAAFYSFNRVESATVLDVVNSDFKEFSKIIANWTTITDLLNNTSENVTLFAPTDKAVNSSVLPSGMALLQLLEYHIVLSYHANMWMDDELLSTFLNLTTLKNNSQVSKITKGMNNMTMLNGAMFAPANMTASNGIVYAIEMVLTPPAMNNSAWVASDSAHSTLQTLLNSSNVGSMVDADATTLFAPTNQAFGNLPSVVVGWLTMNTNESRADLNMVLSNHISSSIYYVDRQVSGTNFDVTTAANESVVVTKPINWPASPAILNHNNASMINGSDLATTNGAVQSITGVLVPSSFDFTLAKLIQGGGYFSFYTAAMMTNVTSMLFNDTQPRTLFVPVNSAFSNSTKLDGPTVLYHGIDQVIPKSSFMNGQLYPSLTVLASLGGNHQQLKFTLGGTNNTDVYVNGAKIIMADLMTTSGNIVHIIDSLLMLPSSIPVVASAANFSTFIQAVNQAAVAMDLDGMNLTVFAPTDMAFEGLPNGTVGYLMQNTTKSIADLSNVVLNHVIRNDIIFYSQNIPNATLNTLANTTVMTRKTSSGAWVDGAAVVDTDNIASNGVVHGLSEVLIPSSVMINVADLLVGLGNFQTLLHLLNSSELLYNFTGNGNVTLFAPDDDAFSRVEDLNDLENNATRLRSVLLNHIIYEPIAMLNQSNRFPTENVNLTLVVTSVSDGVIMVELENQDGDSEGQATIIESTRTLDGHGYIYVLDTVLGVAQEEESSSGLKTWQIVLIVVGGVIVGLLLLALVTAIIYFAIFRPRSGYRKIN